MQRNLSLNPAAPDFSLYPFLRSKFLPLFAIPSPFLMMFFQACLRIQTVSAGLPFFLFEAKVEDGCQF